MNLTEKAINTRTIYQGRIFDVESSTVELPDGKEAVRDIVRHPGAVVLVPLTDEGKVVLVRQFRFAVNGVLLELPAGKLEIGEEPEKAALRELKEETGYSCSELIPLFTYYSSPGFTDEQMYLYLALGLEAGESGGDEDEFIELAEIPLDTLVSQILEGRILDGKTIAGILGTYYWMKNRK